MKTIYAVSNGEYSSYCIVALFTTRDLAQRFIDSFMAKDDSAEIEEYDLNPNGISMRKNIFPFLVEMGKSGNIIRCNVTNDSFGFSDNEHSVFIRHNELSISCRCWAKDEKHAIKITNEKRTQLIALDRWVGDKNVIE